MSVLSLLSLWRDPRSKPLEAAAATVLAAAALLLALIALAAASGRAPTPATVIAQAKAKRCASADVGGGVKAVDCRGPRGRRGRRGRRGFTGPLGFKGNNGAGGGAGVRGFQGPQGDQGDTGDQGDKGPDGDPGQPGQPGQPGTAGADGSPGAAGGSDVYADVPDPNVAGSRFTDFKANTVIRTKVVPAGSYIVYGSGQLRNTDDDNTANPSCTLRRDGAVIDTANSNFGDEASTFEDNGADNENISLQASIGAGGTLTLECVENGNSALDTIRSSALVAIRVGTAG